MILEIAQRQQHLSDFEAELVPHLFIGIEQQRHAVGGCGLLVGNPGAFGRFSDDAQAQRNRAGRAEDDPGPLRAQLSDVFQQALEETVARCEQFLVGEQRRTDFDNDSSPMCHGIQMLPWLEIYRAQCR
mgnify:CR=1 FL=1